MKAAEVDVDSYIWIVLFNYVSKTTLDETSVDT